MMTLQERRDRVVAAKAALDAKPRPADGWEAAMSALCEAKERGLLQASDMNMIAIAKIVAHGMARKDPMVAELYEFLEEDRDWEYLPPDHIYFRLYEREHEEAKT